MREVRVYGEGTREEKRDRQTGGHTQTLKQEKDTETLRMNEGASETRGETVREQREDETQTETEVRLCACVCLCVRVCMCVRVRVYL